MAAVRSYDVVVIGGGWSGILSCKYSLENDLSVVVLERRDCLGGVWNYSDDLRETTVMKDTVTSSSSCVTEMSDFAMPEEIGAFPAHQDVLTYLEDYCGKFNLTKHFRFNRSVKQIGKQEDVWETTTECGEVYRSHHMIVCTGVHQRPNDEMKHTTFKEFKGAVTHCGDYKEFCPDHKDKRVMVVGGGEMASDFIQAWQSKVDHLVWCIPRGRFFLKKAGCNFPWLKPLVLDTALSRAMDFVSPMCHGAPGKRVVAPWMTTGSFLNYGNHGIPEFKNDVRYFESFVNKHGDVLKYVDNGTVTPKGAIEGVDGKTIVFADGTRETIDTIILCTGFKHDFNLLAEQHRPTSIRDCYKMCISNEDPSLAFIGFVRPIIASIPVLAEMQARWITRVFSGKVPIADNYQRRETTDADKAYWENLFKDTSNRIDGLVQPVSYINSIAELAGLMPNPWKVLRSDPYAFYRGYFGPYCGAFFRMNEPDNRTTALETIRRHHSFTGLDLQFLMIIVIRLSMISWLLDLLTRVKYRIQTTPSIYRLKDNGVVKVLNTIWTAPKRLFFDNRILYLNRYSDGHIRGDQDINPKPMWNFSWKPVNKML